jgi:hypothetical protein
LTAEHPHIIDWVAVGDGPEGLVISPRGDLAASVQINGTKYSAGNPKIAWAANIFTLAISQTILRQYCVWVMTK